MDPGFGVGDWYGLKRDYLFGRVLVIETAGDADFFKVLTDVFFPLTPRIESEEEAASGNGFVGHIARRFSNKTVCPGEDVIDEKVVEIDDVVVMN